MDRGPPAEKAAEVLASTRWWRTLADGQSLTGSLYPPRSCGDPLLRSGHFWPATDFVKWLADELRASGGEKPERESRLDLLHLDDRSLELHASCVNRAITVRVLGQVLLVIVLGEVELGRGPDLGRDCPYPALVSSAWYMHATPRQWPPGHRCGCRWLSDTGCPCHCPADSPGSGRGPPRRPATAAPGHPLRVIHHTHRFGVAGPAGAGLVVVGVRRAAALVADRGDDHAGYLPEIFSGPRSTPARSR